MKHLIFKIGEYYLAIKSHAVGKICLFDGGEDPANGLVSLARIMGLNARERHFLEIKPEAIGAKEDELYLIVSEVEDEVDFEDSFWFKAPRFIERSFEAKIYDGTAFWNEEPIFRIAPMMIWQNMPRYIKGSAA
ncbi:MAG: hypothetical protein LBU73_10390 [Helicobacteraceae bacterium]|nr:hypothetical protein [Helicobacteraceae bacterium]